MRLLSKLQHSEGFEYYVFIILKWFTSLPISYTRATSISKQTKSIKRHNSCRTNKTSTARYDRSIYHKSNSDENLQNDFIVFYLAKHSA